MKKFGIAFVCFGSLFLAACNQTPVPQETTTVTSQGSPMTLCDNKLHLQTDVGVGQNGGGVHTDGEGSGGNSGGGGGSC